MIWSWQRAVWGSPNNKKPVHFGKVYFLTQQQNAWIYSPKSKHQLHGSLVKYNWAEGMRESNCLSLVLMFPHHKARFPKKGSTKRFGFEPTPALTNHESMSSWAKNIPRDSWGKYTTRLSCTRRHLQAHASFEDFCCFSQNEETFFKLKKGDSLSYLLT